MKRLYLLIITVLMLGMAVPSFAGRRKGDRHGKAMEQMERRKLLQMADELNLSDEKLIKLSKVFKNNREKRIRLEAEKKKLGIDAENLLKSEKATDKDFEKLIKKGRDLREKWQKLDNERIDEMEKILTPKQAVQAMMLEKKFRKKMFKMMKNAHGKDGHKGCGSMEGPHGDMPPPPAGKSIECE